MSYMSVDRESLLRAFVLAHREACNPANSSAQVFKFHAIAKAIWTACGEQKPMPRELPVEAAAIAERGREAAL